MNYNVCATNIKQNWKRADCFQTGFLNTSISQQTDPLQTMAGLTCTLHIRYNRRRPLNYKGKLLWGLVADLHLLFQYLHSQVMHTRVGVGDARYTSGVHNFSNNSTDRSQLFHLHDGYHTSRHRSDDIFQGIRPVFLFKSLL